MGSEKWEILTPDGETYIPDRLLFQMKTIILDYKTGNPKKQIQIKLFNILISY